MKSLITIILAIIAISTNAEHWDFQSENAKASLSSICEYGNGNDVECKAQLKLKEKSKSLIVLIENASCSKYKESDVVGQVESEEKGLIYSFSKTYSFSTNGSVNSKYTVCAYNSDDSKESSLTGLSVDVQGYSD